MKFEYCFLVVILLWVAMIVGCFYEIIGSPRQQVHYSYAPDYIGQ